MLVWGYRVRAPSVVAEVINSCQEGHCEPYFLDTVKEDFLSRGEYRWTKVGTDSNKCTGDDTSAAMRTLITSTVHIIECNMQM